jgi:MinD superfamily P-loop ATPase
MSYQITEKCTNCGDCLAVCPLDAISAGEKHPSIDPALCTDCGTCADICPVRAIEGAPQAQGKSRAFNAENAEGE